MNIEILIALVVFLPLIGGLADFIINEADRSISTFFVAAALICSLLLLTSYEKVYLMKMNWIDELQVGIFIDRIACILLVLVCIISLMVNVFSLAYMKGDPGRARYFGKLGFFTFSMLGLLIADSLILFFIFWEFVGLASYLLIGFWFRKEGVASAAKTAFMVNRVADVALLAGILILNTSAESIFISEFSGTWFLLPSILISIGAFGKSAQVPFSGWLVKAMAGPTPVSALIHAATMVAAGVYLLFRVAPFLDLQVLFLISIIGSVTTLYGGISAMVQNDVKKVLAYSTISQLGFMLIGIGVGAGEASLFHLWTHAFFKAGLFLGAGSVIHFMQKTIGESGNPQDMRLMGGLKARLPFTFWTFIVFSLALSGLPFFSGFMSKEGIVFAALAWADQAGNLGYAVADTALISTLITAFYITRLTVLVFLGEKRNSHSFNLEWKESRQFILTLIVLSLGSIWIFYSLNPFSHLSPFGSASSSNGVLISSSVVGISILLALVGVILSYVLFKPGSNYSKLYRDIESPTSFGGRLVYDGLYLTKVYAFAGSAAVATARALRLIEIKLIDRLINSLAIASVVGAKVLSIFDRLVVDGLVNLVSSISVFIGRRTAGLHSREAQWQLIWLLLLIVLILGWILLF